MNRFALACAALAVAGSAFGSAWSNTGRGNWTTASNWKENAVAGTASVATNNVGGTVVVGAGDAITSRGLYLGVNAGTTGAFEMSGGTLTLTDLVGLRLGDATTGRGTAVMTGGALEVLQAQIGCDGPGEFTVSGGTVTIKDWSAIGRYANGKGKMTITGGAEVTCIRNGSADTCLFVAEEGEGELVIEDGGKLTFTTDNQCGFVSPNNDKGRGTTWLKTGGTIATRELHIQAAGTRFILDGGTIVANAGTGTFIGNKGSFEITDNGGAIDIGAVDRTVWIGFDAYAGSTSGVIAKRGTGTLTLNYSGTYRGGWDIQAGTLSVAGPHMLMGYATAPITVAAGAKLALGKYWTDAQVAALKANPNFSAADGDAAVTRAAHDPTAPIELFSQDGYTIHVAGQTFGAPVKKTGTGTLVIDEPCVFQGGVTVEAGILEADWETSGLKDTHVVLGGGSSPGSPGFLRVRGVGGTFAPVLGTSGNTVELRTFCGILPGDGPMTLDFFGDGRMLQLMTGGCQFTDLVINDRKDWPVHLRNPIDLNGQGRTLKTRNSAPLYMDGGLTNTTGNGVLYFWDGNAVFPDVPGKGADVFAYRLNPRSGTWLFTNAVVRTSNDIIVGNNDASSGRALVTYKDCDKRSTDGWDYVNGATGTTVTVDGGTYYSAGQLNVGYTAAGRTGTFVMTNGADVSVNKIAQWSGDVYQYSGKLTLRNETWTGHDNTDGTHAPGSGYARHVMYGGEIYAGDGVNWQIGSYGKGLLWMLGGSVNVAAYPCVGRRPGSVGEFRLHGGSFYHRKHVSNNNNLFFVAEEGTGFMSVANGGRFETENAYGMQVSSKETAQGALMLSPDGTVVASHVYGSGSSISDGVVFNGGTLVARSGDYKSGLLNDNLDRHAVTPYGGAIDTNGKGDFTLTKALVAATTAQDLAESIAHRWSFRDGSLADGIAGAAAALTGDASRFERTDGTLALKGGAMGTACVKLGTDLLPEDGRGATLEFWFTPNEDRAWTRLFNFGKNGNEMYLALRNNDQMPIFTINGFTSVALTHKLAAGRRYHAACSVGQVPDGRWEMRFALHDGATGEAIAAGSRLTDAGSAFNFANIAKNAAQNGCWLGHSSFTADNDPKVAYHEVRIHHRVLTPAQIAASAVAGADRVYAFTKKGAGMLTLVGANTYKAGTAVEQGTLALAAGATIPATDWVVAQDAVLSLNTTAQTAASIQGAGTVRGGAVTVTREILPGGRDRVGTLVLENTDLSASGATLVADVSADGTCDCLALTKAVNVTGMKFRLGATASLNEKKGYTVLTAPSVTGAFDEVEIPRRWVLSVGQAAVRLCFGAGTVLLVR